VREEIERNGNFELYLKKTCSSKKKYYFILFCGGRVGLNACSNLLKESGKDFFVHANAF
jgi:hypothetical protein